MPGPSHDPSQVLPVSTTETPPTQGPFLSLLFLTDQAREHRATAAVQSDSVTQQAQTVGLCTVMARDGCTSKPGEGHAVRIPAQETEGSKKLQTAVSMATQRLPVCSPTISRPKAQDSAAPA